MSCKFVHLKNLQSSMNARRVSLERFEFEFNRVEFECIVDVGASPIELLLGARRETWATVLLVDGDFNSEMSDRDFYNLCDILHLRPGKGSLTSFEFLKFISTHMPSTSIGAPIRPSIIMRYRKPNSGSKDDNSKTVFIGWNDHKTDGRTARNFDKTERYFGKRVADFCRAHNVSSIWTYPESGREIAPLFPPGY